MGDGRRRRLGCFGLLVDLWGLGWRRRTGQLQLLPSFSSSDNALSAIPPPKCSKLSPSPFTVCMQLPYEQTHVLMPALLSAPNCSQIGVILPLYAKRQRWEQPAHPGLLIPPPSCPPPLRCRNSSPSVLTEGNTLELNSGPGRVLPHPSRVGCV